MPQFPTVNLNGTSRESLIEQQTDVLNALYEVQEALRHAVPNGRDFVPQGSPAAREALSAALREHYSRVQRIREISEEVMAIAEHLQQ